jgi:tetratricopeptide (TPR) repeat protein
MADPPSWRDRDRKKDRSAHRQEESRPRGPAPRIESATAAYKRQLDAVFSGGALPAHLKEKLGEAPVGEAGERQKKLRAVLTAATPAEQVAALNAFLAEHELPDDLDFIERALAHPKDAVLLAALGKLEAHLDRRQGGAPQGPPACAAGRGGGLVLQRQGAAAGRRTRGATAVRVRESFAVLRWSHRISLLEGVRVRNPWYLLLFALIAGCGGASAPALRLQAPAPTDAAALAGAANDFYRAPDPAGMRAAVEAARTAGPDSALYHELAAELARFEDRERDQVDHLLQGLLDPTGDAPIHLINRLVGLPWTFEERARVDQVMGALRREHPRAPVRAMAAWVASHAAHLEGRTPQQQAALAEVAGQLPLALIGPWDNDQGKGFDAEYPPERELNLKATYLGSRLEVGWRTDYPIDPRGKVHLHSVMEPVKWQVGYAATAVDVKSAGDYELRVSSTDPVKVWVNEVLVFVAPRIRIWTFDGITVPVKLRAGVNRVLIKSAHGADGGWMLVARLTGPEGASLAADAFKPVAADTPMADGERPRAEPLTEEGLLPAAVAGVPDGLRKGVLVSAFAEDIGLNVARVKIAETLAAAFPESLYVRYLKAAALWDNQERGNTSDLLNDLAAKFGDDLILIALKQARFWEQQGLGEKARARLTTLRQAHPDRDGVAYALADMLGEEAWQEERCQILEQLNQRHPAFERVQDALADCLEKLRFFPRAEAMQVALLERLPNSYDALRRLHWLAQGRDDHAAAGRYARRWVAAWPHDRQAFEALAETLRREGKVEEARKVLESLVKLAPTAAVGYDRLASLAMQAQDRAEAVRLWKEALARDPENESLANRIQYLAPEKAGPWLADVPDEAAIEAAVRKRDEVKPLPGANIIYLLDDEVTALRADGSTVNYVTTVAYAVNDAGRDRLTHQTLRSDGRARVLHAYAVDEAGKRTEASTIRGRSVRFRQLGVGTTVVLQYRLDSAPDGYLASHLARQWWFAGPAGQTLRSRWVLYAPPGTPLLESRRGEFAREQAPVGDLLRTMWTATGVQPVVPEPAMPTLHEAAANLVVSTVPDWDMFVQWETSLLKDAFRVGPEVEALAAKLWRQGAQDPAEKVAAHPGLADGRTCATSRTTRATSRA